MYMYGDPYVTLSYGLPTGGSGHAPRALRACRLLADRAGAVSMNFGSFYIGRGPNMVEYNMV